MLKLRLIRRLGLAAGIVALVWISHSGWLADALHGPAPEGSLAVEHRGSRAADETIDADRWTIRSVVREHHRTADDASLDSLTDAVYEEALSAGVDPLMVAAIVAKESSFRTAVVSHAGAVGLMQLRPFVARDVAERFDQEWSGTETLLHPETNVRLGALYYRELVERFDGDVEIALAAYNRGPSRVSRQLREGTFDGSRYAERVLGFYRELDAARSSLHSLSS